MIFDDISERHLINALILEGYGRKSRARAGSQGQSIIQYRDDEMTITPSNYYDLPLASSYYHYESKIDIRTCLPHIKTLYLNGRHMVTENELNHFPVRTVCPSDIEITVMGPIKETVLYCNGANIRLYRETSSIKNLTVLLPTSIPCGRFHINGSRYNDGSGLEGFHTNAREIHVDMFDIHMTCTETDYLYEELRHDRFAGMNIDPQTNQIYARVGNKDLFSIIICDKDHLDRLDVLSMEWVKKHAGSLYGRWYVIIR